MKFVFMQTGWGKELFAVKTIEFFWGGTLSGDTP